MARTSEKPLWTEIDGEPWIDNPRRRKSRKGRKRKRGRVRAAGARRSGRRKRRMPAGLAAYWANKRGGRTVAKRRRHSSRRRRGARRYRANPPSGMTRGLMGRVLEGVKGGAGVVLGKAAVRAIPTMAQLPRTGPIGIAIQAGVGVLLAPFVDRFFRGLGKPFLYGAFAAPLESLVVSLNIPVIGPALSSYPDELSAIPATVTALGMGAAPGFMIDDEEQALVQ